MLWSRRRAALALLAPALGGQNRQNRMFENAEAYERFMGRWSRLLAPLLVDFSNLGETGRVLDIGSGTGSLAAAAARIKPGIGVTGIDPSPEYVSFAQSRNPASERIAYEVGDAQKLRFEAGTCDASLSLLVFNFIPDRRLALRELLRVTKTGGRIAAAVWDYGDGMRMLRVFWDAAVQLDPAAAKRDERHMPLCRPGELAQFWNEGGLQEVVEAPLEITMPFTSFADYWEPFLLGQGPAGAYVKGLAPGPREALRSDVKRRLAWKDEDSPLSLPARAWAVRGIVPPRT
jgi:SAM-dependent methyltransferase